MKSEDNEFPYITVKEESAPTSPASGDQRLFIDSADHVAKLKNSSGTVTPVGGAGSDTTAFHNNVDSEISALTALTTPGSGDFLLAETGSGGHKRKVDIANLPSGGSAFSVYPTLTTPLSSDFGWLNPGSYTVTNADKTGRLVLTAAASATGAAFMQTAALLSTPYTIDLGFLAAAPSSTDLVGIALKNSGGAPIRTFGLRMDSVGYWYLNLQAWTAANAPSTQAPTGLFGFGALTQIMFLRITDNGTTRSFYWSHNGRDYNLWETEATNTGVTPDRVGIHLYNGSSTVMLTSSVYHWLISNSVLPTIGA